MCMKNMVKQSLLLTLLFTSAASQADMFTPSHSCRKPHKPYEFKHQYEIDSFKSDVERYRRCIQDFVEEQNEAAKRHADAAEEAIEEWNRYVNYELR